MENVETETVATKKPKRAYRKKTFEPMEQQIGQDHPRAMPNAGPVKLEPAFIETVGGRDMQALKKKAEILAFMEEEVEVFVHESNENEKNPEVVIHTANSGRNQFFIRGTAQTVKRKFVESLARAKTKRYRQEMYQDENGMNAYRNIPRTSLRYPFSVTRDTPKGQEWLKRVLAEG